VRHSKSVSTTEVSLDAPVDRSDREASTFGERFAGTDGDEIEDVTDAKLMREFIDSVVPRYLTPRERRFSTCITGSSRGQRRSRSSASAR